MSHVPHELVADFPEAADKIAELRQTNAHFAKLMDQYHKVNRNVHRAETDIEPVTDAHMQQLRKDRMRLKDDIYALLSA